MAMHVIRMPKRGTNLRRAAEALLRIKGKKGWWTPETPQLSRAARDLRAVHGWYIISDTKLNGSRVHSYQIDPERRPHYKFVD